MCIWTICSKKRTTAAKPSSSEHSVTLFGFVCNICKLSFQSICLCVLLCTMILQIAVVVFVLHIGLRTNFNIVVDLIWNSDWGQHSQFHTSLWLGNILSDPLCNCSIKAFSKYTSSKIFSYFKSKQLQRP